MAKTVVNETGRKPNLARLLGWGMAGLLLLLLPLVAMQFTNEVKWDGADFVFAGVVFGGIGIAFEVAFSASRRPAYRAAVAAAVAASYVIVWANAAVGMIGDAPNVYNNLFLCLVGFAVVGAVIARLRASGMARTMVVAGVAHLAIAGAGMTIDIRGGTISAVLACLWLLAGALFRRAARGAAADATLVRS